MKYRGKVDWWIGAVLAGALLLPAHEAVFTRAHWVGVIPVSLAALVFGLYYPQEYETAADSLLIRAGFRTIRIPYSDIRSVEPSSDISSALAMSLDRVLIVFGSSEILIAPDRKQEFLADLRLKAGLPEKKSQS